MSFYDRIVGGLKNQILLSDQVTRISANVDKLQADIFDHEKRLIRIETLIDLTRSGVGPRGRPPP